MLFESTSFKSFTYFFMIFKSDIAVMLLVVIIIPLLSDQIKLTKISNLIFLKSLLMLVIICTFDYTITVSMLFISIGMMTCFLEESFTVMLRLGLSFLLDLLMMLWILEILSIDSLENTSLILKNSLTLFLSITSLKS